MPSSKDDQPTSASDAPKAKRRRFPRGGPTKAELKKLRETLLELRTGIMRSSRKLADEALKGSGQDFSVDHMADHGTDNFEQDFSLSLLEGETQLFRDIQHAIEKIDGKGDLPYGVCETCADEPAEDSELGPWIAKGRLEAVPYARLCIPHQELAEEGQA